MKYIIQIIIVITLISCSSSNNASSSNYFTLVNKAELLICTGNFKQASEAYTKAFFEIKKPFGKDLFNAALTSQLSNNLKERNNRLQSIINNSTDLDHVKSKFVGSYLTEKEWQLLISKQKIEFDPKLRVEFEEIQERDQLFRPMYDTHDDTINANRKINMSRILSLTDAIGFPSHIELGYTNYLRGQKHDIVLHHTAQRRSYDKTVTDLEPILLNAVNEGRFDPEQAIVYLNFQNDQEKGPFEVYSTWQHKHPLLPDSLNNKVWLIKLDKKQKLKANNKRKEWNANSLEDIAAKSNFLAQNKLPFIFTSVHKSIGNLKDDFDKQTAIKQYEGFTSGMEEYKE